MSCTDNLLDDEESSPLKQTHAARDMLYVYIARTSATVHEIDLHNRKDSTQALLPEQNESITPRTALFRPNACCVNAYVASLHTFALRYCSALNSWYQTIVVICKVLRSYVPFETQSAQHEAVYLRRVGQDDFSQITLRQLATVVGLRFQRNQRLFL